MPDDAGGTVPHAERAERALRARRWRKAAEHMAYVQWGYTKPNAAAVESAADCLAKCRQAITAAGFTIETPQSGRKGES